MSFLSPLFLWLLPLISIPVIIHFLNRRNIRIIEFSTLHFLKKMEHESIKRLKILQILLLIIRTLMVLMIVLMISRPVLSGMFNWIDDPESTLSVIVLDDTFSNKGSVELSTRETLLESAFERLLSTIDENSMMVISTIEKGVLFTGLKKDLPDRLLDEYSTFLGGDFSVLILSILNQINREYLNHELFILSDAQQSNFIQGTFDWDQIAEWNTYFYRLPGLDNNLAITDVKVINEIPVTNSPVDIAVTISNTGFQSADNRLLQLSFDEINVGQQVVSLEPGATGTYAFQTAFHLTGLKEGIIELEDDDRMEDNRFYFHVDLLNKMNIQLISSRFDGVLFIRNAILALNQDEDLFLITQGTEQDLQFNLDLRNIDVLVLQGVSEIPPDIQQKIREYVQDGGHLVISPGTDTQKLPDIQNLLSANFLQTVIELGGDSYQILNFSSTSAKAFSQIISNSDKGMIKAFKFIPLPSDEHSLMFVNDDISVWNRYPIGAGLIDVFGISMELGWTNFPITGSFIPFWHRLLYSNSGGKSLKIIETDGAWEIPRVYLQQGQVLQHSLPNGTTNIVQPGKDGSLVITKLVEPGFHRIYDSGSVIYEAAVRIPESELISPSFDDDQLSEKFSGKLLILHHPEEISEGVKMAHLGIELWKWLLLLFILLMITEMLLANVYGAKRHQ